MSTHKEIQLSLAAGFGKLTRALIRIRRQSERARLRVTPRKIAWEWFLWLVFRRRDERIWKVRTERYAKKTGLKIEKGKFDTPRKLVGLPPVTWEIYLMVAIGAHGESIPDPDLF